MLGLHTRALGFRVRSNARVAHKSIGLASARRTQAEASCDVKGSLRSCLVKPSVQSSQTSTSCRRFRGKGLGFRPNVKAGVDIREVGAVSEGDSGGDRPTL
jgi:hypothetical protein